MIQTFQNVFLCENLRKNKIILEKNGNFWNYFWVRVQINFCRVNFFSVFLCNFEYFRLKTLQISKLKKLG